MSRFPQGRDLIICWACGVNVAVSSSCPKAVTRHSLRQQGCNSYIRTAGIRWQLYFGLCAPAKLLEVLSQQQGTPEVTGALQVKILLKPLFEMCMREEVGIDWGACVHLGGGLGE